MERTNERPSGDAKVICVHELGRWVALSFDRDGIKGLSVRA
jgi:hypothetical protein